MQGIQVSSLHQEVPLEEGMAAHSSILAWRIPRTEEPGGAVVHGGHRVRHHSVTNTITYIHVCIYTLVCICQYMHIHTNMLT